MELETLVGLGAGALAVLAATIIINGRRDRTPLKVESVTYDKATHTLNVLVRNSGSKPYCIEKASLRQPAAPSTMPGAGMMTACDLERTMTNLLAESEEGIVISPMDSSTITLKALVPADMGSFETNAPVSFSFEGSELEFSQFSMQGSAHLELQEAQECRAAPVKKAAGSDSAVELQKMLGMYILTNGQDFMSHARYDAPNMIKTPSQLYKPKPDYAGVSLRQYNSLHNPKLQEDAANSVGELSFSAALHVDTPRGQYAIRKVTGDITGQQTIGSSTFVEVKYSRAWGSQINGLYLGKDEWVGICGTLQVKSDNIISITKVHKQPTREPNAGFTLACSQQNR